MPGLAVSGMLSETPRPGAQKSLTWTAPAAQATTPSTISEARDKPISRNAFSHAAMNTR